jgi:hypothetical protein
VTLAVDPEMLIVSVNVAPTAAQMEGESSEAGAVEEEATTEG